MGSETTRQHIVAAADALFYARGYEHTSFADIADAVGISRGNFYYHFKSKDEILDAVIAGRVDGARRMLAAWEAESGGPAGHIRRFIQIVVTNQSQIMRHGCPMGTLCMELTKLGHPSRPRARRLFTLFRNWLGRQFVLLGCEADADALALHALAFSQGIAVLAQTFRDKSCVQQEVARMCAWLDGLPGCNGNDSGSAAHAPGG